MFLTGPLLVLIGLLSLRPLRDLRLLSDTSDSSDSSDSSDRSAPPPITNSQPQKNKTTDAVTFDTTDEQIVRPYRET